MKPHDEHTKQKRQHKKRVRDQRRTRRAMKKLFFETITVTDVGACAVAIALGRPTHSKATPR